MNGATKKRRNLGENRLNHIHNQNQVKNQPKKRHSRSHNQVAHKKTEASHSEQENEDNSQQENESEKISFYLKLGKYKYSNICDFISI